MSKPVKELIIAEIKQRVGDARDLIVLNSAKMDAITTNKWRIALRQQSIRVMVIPNSLGKKAFREAGLGAIESLLVGPSTIAWGGEDIVALSKEIAKWVKDIEALEIKGGTADGKAISAAEVDILSKSPSREELIGQIVGLILAPGARLAGALLGPGGTLCGQVKSIADKAADAPAADAPSAGAPAAT